jgi:hypothetical protein
MRLQSTSLTRFELANELVALNSIAESIVVRVARLADKRRDVRSIKNFCKGQSLSPETQILVEEFAQKAEPVLSIRHNRIAHMKTGDLSTYPLDALPIVVLSAIETLVLLVDALVGQSTSYSLKVGSQEKQVDLRASVSAGARVEV